MHFQVLFDTGRRYGRCPSLRNTQGPGCSRLRSASATPILSQSKDGVAGSLRSPPSASLTRKTGNLHSTVQLLSFCVLSHPEFTRRSRFLAKSVLPAGVCFSRRRRASLTFTRRSPQGEGGQQLSNLSSTANLHLLLRPGASQPSKGYWARSKQPSEGRFSSITQTKPPAPAWPLKSHGHDKPRA